MSKSLDKWASCEFGEISDVVGGGTPPSKDVTNFETHGGIPWITPADLSGYNHQYITRGARNLSPKGFAACSAIMLPKGSVLFSSRAPVGYVVIAANPICTNQGFKSFVLPSEIDSRFAYYYVKFITPLAEERATGTTFKELSGGAVAKLPVRLAPFNEQKRIADKLDAVLARVDACRERLDRVPAILKRFRQAVLAAATSGKLTEEWRKEWGGHSSGRDVVQQDAEAKRNILSRDSSLQKKKSTIESSIDGEYVFEIPEEWVFTTWGTVSEWITYGFTRPMPHAVEGVPLLTARDVRNFTVKFQGAEYTTHTAFAQLSEKDRPKLGDLLLTKDGTIGRAALVRTAAPFCINQSVAVCWLRSTSMNKSYLELVANTDFTQQFIRDKAKGVAIQHLSITDFAQCPLPVPPLPEQHEIARRVEFLFAYAERLGTHYAAACANVVRLPSVLLNKAFCGELVPQDPTDEPAAVLLERIRAARKFAPSGARQLLASRNSQPKTQKPEVIMLNRKDIHDVHLTTILKLRGPLTAEALWSASQLDIDEFYDQLKDEEARGLLKEQRGDSAAAPRILLAAA